MDSYLLMHFHEPVLLMSKGKIDLYPANTFIAWKPGDPHYYGNREIPWRHTWLHCYGSLIPELLKGSSIKFAIPACLLLAASADMHLSQMYRELTSYVKPDEKILESLTTLWVREICRLTRPSGGERYPENFIAVRHYIESRMAERLRMDDLAAMASLSVSHFITRFREHFGVPPLQYQLGLRIRHAAYLLQDRYLTIAQVAQSVGFEDPFYFSRKFRQVFKQSPQQFRRSVLN